MTLTQLIAELGRRRVKLWADGGRLRYSAPFDALSADLRREISEQRDALLLHFEHAREPEQRDVRRDGGRAPLTAGQERLWMIAERQPTDTSYVVATGVRLQGPVQPAAVAAAWRALVGRHDALRTAFGDSDGTPWQHVAPRVPLTVPTIDLRALTAARREAALSALAALAAATPFDLREPPLWRLWWIQLDPADHAVLLVLHHLIADGWSLDVLLRE